jgi:hypothetical protein
MPYDRDLYSRKFARLLNDAMQKGQGDPHKALAWLDQKYKVLFALMFTRHKLETSDAYLDVREHIRKRIENEAETTKDSGG